MPSPFPGIDPYLAEGWHGTAFHTTFSVEIARQLARKLPPTYLAVADDRYDARPSELPPEFTVQIMERSSHRLVTAIEVITPATKVGDRRAYLGKRDRLLRSSTNLIEVDLVSQGEPLPMQRPLPPAAGFVLVSRAHQRGVAEVWPISLESALPTIPVPLTPDVSDCPLDLQAAHDEIYDTFDFGELIDYDDDPCVPLTEEERARLRTVRRDWR